MKNSLLILPAIMLFAGCANEPRRQASQHQSTSASHSTAMHSGQRTLAATGNSPSDQQHENFNPRSQSNSQRYEEAGAPGSSTSTMRRQAGYQGQHSAVEQIISQWPASSKLGARQMIEKYGPPQEATPQRIIWHNQGPYKRITVTRQQTPHDFPLPHMDFMEHTISYVVPPERASELAAYDGSCNFDRTRGELSARCDLEAHNILTLNLAHDLLTGKLTAEQAREQFGQHTVAELMGNNPEYVQRLRFQPAGEKAGFTDQATIPGAPVRAEELQTLTPTGRPSPGDGEILGYLVAINKKEIYAAEQTKKEKVSQQVTEYADMLHKEHGQNLQATMKIGQEIGTPPVITSGVNQLMEKGADQLAALVPLDGRNYGSAYLKAMIQGHKEALDLIDNQLLKAARHEKLRQHLTETRTHIAHHLEEAQQLSQARPQR